MSYMLLIIEPAGQREQRTEAQGRAVYGRMVAFAADLRSRGLLTHTESLASLEQSARVSQAGGRQQVVDGPFAEAKEMIGGFFLLTCNTLDEAVAIARQCPAAEWATVEVRAVAPCYDNSHAPAQAVAST